MSMPDDCRRFEEIERGSSEGSEPDREDREFAEKHLSTCESCRIEVEALAALRGDGNAGPMKPLDDLARRRFIDEVIAGRAARSEEPPRRFRKDAAIIAAASVAAVAATVVAIGFHPKRPAVDTAGKIATALGPAKLVLASGDGEISRAGTETPRDVWPGTRLETDTGELWLCLPTGFAISLEPQTRASIQRLDRDAMSLEFERGRLLVSATAGRTGPRLVVKTREGDVTVKGTVFAIDDRSGSVEVVVAQGIVSVERARGGNLEVGPSEAMTLDNGAARRTRADEEAALLSRAAAFHILDPEARASLVLHSVPPGAKAELDGVFLGSTPLVAAVLPGQRRIDVLFDGHPPITEIVSLDPGSVVVRRFDARTVTGEPIPDGKEAASPALATGSPRPAAKTNRAATAQDLLRTAQEHRASRDFAEAARAYEDLLRSFPSSDEARAALVSLGQLEVDRLGKPAAALRHFDTYLDMRGKAPLEVEALLGRARALAALGRVAEERTTLERFLERFPDAIQAPSARRRLAEIRGSESGEPRTR